VTTEEKLLEIIAKIATDKALQTKVIALYEDHKLEPLKKYAWFNESQKKDEFKNPLFDSLFGHPIKR
jgi:hypothetical protein